MTSWFFGFAHSVARTATQIHPPRVRRAGSEPRRNRCPKPIILCRNSRSGDRITAARTLNTAPFGIGSIGHKRFWILFVAILLAQPACADALGSEQNGTLTVRIENAAPQGGIVRLGLYDAAHYPDNNSQPTASVDAPAATGEVVITLMDIPPGIYAIETFQDINANGKLDMSWIGLPLEPFGFSRDARPIFGKPDFSAVSFAVVAGVNSQSLRFQNSISQLATNKR